MNKLQRLRRRFEYWIHQNTEDAILLSGLGGVFLMFLQMYLFH